MAEVTAQGRRFSSVGGQGQKEEMDLEKVHAAYEEGKLV
jgi:hypothetical protein